MRTARAFLGRALRLAAAVTILAAGSLHLHPVEPPSGHWTAPSAASLLRSAASHPQAPAHIESVELERTPRCPECLVRGHGAALAPPRAALSAASPGSFLAPASVEGRVLHRAGGPGQPRAPPLL